MRIEAKEGTPFIIDMGKTWEFGMVVSARYSGFTPLIQIIRLTTCSTTADGQLVWTPKQAEVSTETYLPGLPIFKNLKFLPHPENCGE
jgi:hypothetical protein